MTGGATWSAPEGRVELELVERLPDDLPTAGDARLAVVLRPEGALPVEYDGAWLQRPELEAFAVELEEWLAIAEGSPRIEAMSPDELELELVTGRDGAAADLRVRLGRAGVSGARTEAIDVEVRVGLSGAEAAGLHGFVSRLLERPG